MKILHVTLGNPESRRGGLNRYCREIMSSQEKMGHDVYVIYPGSLGTNENTKIKKEKRNSFKIINSLPVPIIYGIDKPSRYMKLGDELLYYNWLRILSPDIIHVHSIQGIHKEFFVQAKKLNIKMIFTTHDYYPICFKAILFDGYKVCAGYNSEKCSICNYGCGLSLGKQQVLQSEIYPYLKKIKGIAWIKKIISIKTKKKNNSSKNYKKSQQTIGKFRKLHNYYMEILDCFTVIHCNSQRAYDYYCQYVDKEKCKIIPITHSGLTRQVKLKRRGYDNKIRIAYIGGPAAYKGYFVFEEALNLLKNEKKSWEAYFYGGDFSKVDTNERKYKGYFEK